MRTCEHCGGMGRSSYLTVPLICSACQGTGLICLGHESADRYAVLVAQARAKAARLGWQETVWESVGNGISRKVRRTVTAEHAHSEVA
jgi:hypothetical protein